MEIKPFDKDAQFIGSTVLKSIESIPVFSQKRMFNIFKELGVPQIMPELWYPFQTLVDFYKELEKSFGPNTLFDMGKAIPEAAILPPDIDSIGTALGTINIAYNMNHKGYVGFHDMVSHDKESKTIIMDNYTPFPSDVHRGVYTGMARRFKTGVRVIIDNTSLEAQNQYLNRFVITYR